MYANREDAAPTRSARQEGTPGLLQVRSAAKLRWLIVALGIATNLAIMSLLILDLRSAQERALTDAGRATETLAEALEEHAVQTFTRLDLGLRALDDDPTTPGITFPGDLVRAQAQLSQIQRMSPTLQRIEMTDAAGSVLISGESYTPPKRNYADLEAFTVHRADPAHGLFVGLLILSAQPGDWTIGVSRRLETRESHFAGVIIGSLNAEYFQRLYRSIDVQAKGVVSLFLRDGRLLARHPSFDALIGSSIADEPLFREYVSSGRSGTFRTFDSIDGFGRVVSIRLFRDLPLVLTVSMSESAILSEWRIAARDGAVLVAVAIVATWAVVFLLWRMLGVREVWERELAAAHEAAEAARRRAEAASNAKSGFVATISHELRTPLNAMLGFADMIRQQTCGPIGEPRYIEFAGTIAEAGSRLLGLVNNLLDIAKIEAGKYDLEEALHDPMALIRDCCTVLEPQLRAGNLTLQVTPPAPPFLVAVDAEAIGRVILNLLFNAIKFTPAGGRIAISAAIDLHGGASIVVKDTGIGISPSDVKRALEPFGQVPGAQRRQTPGTGLGLPIAKRLMERHGGDLILESSPGSGTTATIRLPAFRIRAPATAA
ncbi:MAG: hypothetical protein HYR63_05750 [Proteobacteria bacterium]|nr:hypothetical protein [Pseudomonadota bacterium]MBI3495798.1 hypothetical protein [Pseudomonadota bacterium]